MQTQNDVSKGADARLTMAYLYVFVCSGCVNKRKTNKIYTIYQQTGTRFIFASPAFQTTSTQPAMTFAISAFIQFTTTSMNHPFKICNLFNTHAVFHLQNQKSPKIFQSPWNHCQNLENICAWLIVPVVILYLFTDRIEIDGGLWT